MAITNSSDEDELTMALRLSLLSFEEEDSRRQSEDDDLQRALILSRPPSDIFNEQVGELNQQRGGRASMPASLRTAEVRR